jgi:hypothetical protein
MDGKCLDTDTITLDLSFLLETVEFGHDVFGKSVLTGDEHNLTTSKLETSSVKGLFCMLNEVWFGPDGHKNLINGDTSSLDVWLTESLTHTLLESICTSA